MNNSNFSQIYKIRHLIKRYIIKNQMSHQFSFEEFNSKQGHKKLRIKKNKKRSNK